MVEFIRGDNKNIIFQRVKKGSQEVITTKPDQMYFTVKYDYIQKDAIIFKTFGNGITFDDKNYCYYVALKPDDTNNLPYGKYVFDVEIIENNKKSTILIDELELKGEVTHQYNEIQVIVEEADYETIKNKPKINGVELVGNKTSEELGISIPDTSNFVTKDTTELLNYTTTENLENDYAKKTDIAYFIKKDVDDLQNYTLTSDLERDYAKKGEIPLTDGFIKKDVTDLDNFYNQTEIDEKIDEETSDLLQGLSRELKPDEENGGFSSQTIVNVKNKNGATEMIMEIDNLDVKTDVATNSVLGTLKGQDLDERVQKLEQTPIKVIELHADITNDNRKAHVYPDLTLNEDELKIVIDNNISILKVTYNITGTTSDSETSELVFYTTIDNVTTIKGQNTVKTYKVNATRTNDEGTIIYHAELMGNGKEYPKSATLNATYVQHSPVAASISNKQSVWS